MGRGEKCIQGFGEETWRKHHMEDRGVMDLQEMGWNTVGWINLAQDRNMLRAVVNTAMKFKTPQYVVNFLTS
jgi:hypothetical protein